MQLKGGPFGYIDQSIFSSSNTAQSQLPDIEEMRWLLRSQQEEMDEVVDKNVEEKIAEHAWLVEQQRNEERMEWQGIVCRG